MVIVTLECLSPNDQVSLLVAGRWVPPWLMVVPVRMARSRPEGETWIKALSGPHPMDQPALWLRNDDLEESTVPCGASPQWPIVYMWMVNFQRMNRIVPVGIMPRAALQTFCVGPSPYRCM